MENGPQKPRRGDAATARLAALRWLPAALAGTPLALTRYVRHLCFQWAAALAYYTVFCLVPVLAGLFALSKVFGLHRELTPYLMSTIGAGSTRMTEQIVEFIDRTNVQAVGLLSVVAALFGVFVILANAELCMNTIWGNVPGRPMLHKLGAFAKVMTAAPLLLLPALGLTAILQPGSLTREFFEAWSLGYLVLWFLRLLPYALLYCAFTVFYTRLPNTEVRWKSALVGAVVAGTLWQLAQATYIVFVIKLVRYSAVYGALWQLPILIAWIYVAWSVILFGAEMTRAHHEVIERRLTSLPPAPPEPDTGRVG